MPRHRNPARRLCHDRRDVYGKAFCDSLDRDTHEREVRALRDDWGHWVARWRRALSRDPPPELSADPITEHDRLRLRLRSNTGGAVELEAQWLASMRPPPDDLITGAAFVGSKELKAHACYELEAHATVRTVARATE